MSVDLLAALITLLRPDVQPAAARAAAQQALDRVRLPSDVAKRGGRRLAAGTLRERVVTVLRTMPYAPSRRELYPKVSGNRASVHAEVTRMITEGTVIVHKSRRQIGLLLADGTSMRDAVKT